MPRANFTKVESALDEGLRKLMVGQLLNEADVNQGTPSAPGAQAANKQLLIALQHELHYLHRLGLTPYKQLKLRKKKFAGWVEHPETVTEKEWEMIKGLKDKLTQIRTDYEKKIKVGDNETLVDSERRKHIYKRFNINEKWLPIT